MLYTCNMSTESVRPLLYRLYIEARDDMAAVLAVVAEPGNTYFVDHITGARMLILEIRDHGAVVRQLSGSLRYWTWEEIATTIMKSGH